MSTGPAKWQSVGDHPRVIGREGRDPRLPKPIIQTEGRRITTQRPSIRIMDLHSGQSSQLVIDANDRSAQFLATVARRGVVQQVGNRHFNEQ